MWFFVALCFADDPRPTDATEATVATEPVPLRSEWSDQPVSLARLALTQPRPPDDRALASEARREAIASLSQCCAGRLAATGLWVLREDPTFAMRARSDDQPVELLRVQLSDRAPFGWRVFAREVRRQKFEVVKALLVAELTP